MDVDATSPEPGAAALEEHAGFVRALARSLLLGADDVDDVVQETHLAALRRGPGDRQQLRRWMGVVAWRAGLRVLRSRRRRLRRERTAARGESLGATVDAVVQLDIQRALVDAVQSLAEPYRSSIVMRYFHGLTPTEIANAVDAPVRTVETRLRRALAKLRERLDRAHHGDRRAWQAALIPLAGIRPLLPASGSVAGGAAAAGLAAKVWLAISIAVLGILVGIGVTPGHPDRAPAERAERPSDSGRLPTLRPRAPQPDPRAPPGPADEAPPQVVASQPSRHGPARRPVTTLDRGPGNSVRGTVTGEGGAPLPPEVRIRLTGWLANERGVVALGRAPDVGQEKEANAVGGYEFLGLAPGVYSVTVEARGYVPAHLRTHWISETYGLRFSPVLSRGCEAAVRVVDARGMPVVGRVVRLVATHGRRRVVRPSTVATDADGVARWSLLEEGWYRAQPAEGKAWSPRSLQVRERDARTVECRVSIGTEIAGLVCGPRGAPLPGVRLEFVGEPDPDGIHWATTEAGDDGRYRVAGLPSGTYRVHLRRPGLSAFGPVIEVSEGEVVGHDIVVGTSRLGGRLTRETTGRPWAKASIRATRLGDRVTEASVKPTAAGLWTIRGLPAGRYLVTVSPSLSELQVARRVVTLEADGDRVVDVTILDRAPGTLSLTFSGRSPRDEIKLWRKVAGGGFMLLSGRCDDDTVELRLERGLNELIVYRNGRAAGEILVDMPPGGRIRRTFDLGEADR